MANTRKNNDDIPSVEFITPSGESYLLTPKIAELMNFLAFSSKEKLDQFLQGLVADNQAIKVSMENIQTERKGNQYVQTFGVTDGLKSPLFIFHLAEKDAIQSQSNKELDTNAPKPRR